MSGERLVRGCLVLYGFLAELGSSSLPLVEGLGLDLPLLLQAVDDIPVTPTEVVRQPLDGAVLPPWLQP